MHDTHLLAQLASERAHVLRAVDGLSEEDLSRPAAPSGWSITQLLNHLTFDDEMFWISAVLGGDAEAIADLYDGWSSRSSRTRPCGRRSWSLPTLPAPST